MKHDQKKDAWQEKYSNVDEDEQMEQRSSSSTRKQAISFDAFIGMSDKQIQNICNSLEIPAATTRMGNMGSIVNYLQENKISLFDIGIYPKEEEYESEQIQSEDSNVDPEWSPLQIINPENENEILEYDTEEEEEDDDEKQEDSGKWNYKSANEFQAALITLLHFCIGGQRKQVIEYMTIEVMNCISGIYNK